MTSRGGHCGAEGSQWHGTYMVRLARCSGLHATCAGCHRCVLFDADFKKSGTLALQCSACDCASLSLPRSSCADLSDVVTHVGLSETEVDIVDSLGVRCGLGLLAGCRWKSHRKCLQTATLSPTPPACSS